MLLLSRVQGDETAEPPVEACLVWGSFYLYVNMCTMCACMADVDTTGGHSKRVGRRSAFGNYQNV